MRRHFSRSVGFLTIALAAFVVAACDSNSSPVAPSVPNVSGFPGPSASLGATIRGQVNGLGGTGVGALRSATADNAVMIQVLGTDVMDDVDASGQFVLSGVPAASNVALRLSSSTMDVTVSLGAVEEDETVTVVLAVVGDGVEMVSELREVDDSSSDNVADTSGDDSLDDDSSDDDDSLDDDSSDDDDSLDDDSSDDDDSRDDDSSDDDDN